MNDPCVFCGVPQLVAVLLPGHTDVEAVVCLACGTVQPVPATITRDRAD